MLVMSPFTRSLIAGVARVKVLASTPPLSESFVGKLKTPGVSQWNLLGLRA